MLLAISWILPSIFVSSRNRSALDLEPELRHLLPHVLPKQRKVRLGREYVFCTGDLDLDRADDRPRLSRRDVRLLQNLERFGLHCAHAKRSIKSRVNCRDYRS